MGIFASKGGGEGGRGLEVGPLGAFMSLFLFHFVPHIYVPASRAVKMAGAPHQSSKEEKNVMIEMQSRFIPKFCFTHIMR